MTSPVTLFPARFLLLRAGLRHLRVYWTLIKSLQTGLLLVTGLAGYLSGVPVAHFAGEAAALAASLFLAISGSTVLNMVWDRDIDALMQRTCRRPLPSGMAGTGETLGLGILLSIGGVVWAFILQPLYGLAVFGGLFFDFAIYTAWLKRRSPWSIVWGGLAGGMPILAGRVLATGVFDLAGGLMALAVLFWIPTHILTFSLRNAQDYARAGVPVMPNIFGERATLAIIAGSTVAAVMTIVAAARLAGTAPPYLWALGSLGVPLVITAILQIMIHSSKLNFLLFKMASVYMLAAMALIMVGSIT
jgi:heme o synthase